MISLIARACADQNFESKQKKRSNAIQIIDPSTGTEVEVVSMKMKQLTKDLLIRG